MDEYRSRVEDGDGTIVPELSLQHLLENCTDFANEISQLEHVGKSLGVRVLITTKYHAKYAGEGIEYSWGYSKSGFQRHPLSAKKGKDNFILFVNKCLSQDFITKELVRKVSKRARKYMLAYQALDSDEIKEQPTTETKGISKQMIHKMVK